MKVAIAFMLVAFSCLFATCSAFDLPQMENLEPFQKYFCLRQLDSCLQKYGAAMNTEAADKDFQMKCAFQYVILVVRELSELLGCSIEDILLALGMSEMTLGEMEDVVTGATSVNNLDPVQCEDFLTELLKGIIDIMLSLLCQLLRPFSDILEGIIGPDGPMGDVLGSLLGEENGGFLGGILGGEGGGFLGGILEGEGGGLLEGILGKEGGGLLGGLLGGDNGGLLGSLLGGENGGLLGGGLGVDGLLGGILSGGDKEKNKQPEEQSSGVPVDFEKYVPVQDTTYGVDVSEGRVDGSFIGSNFQDGIPSNFGGMIGDYDGSIFWGNTDQYVAGSMGDYSEGSVVIGGVGGQTESYDRYSEQGVLGGIQVPNEVQIVKDTEGGETADGVTEWVFVSEIEYYEDSEEELGEEEFYSENGVRGAADDGVAGKNGGIIVEGIEGAGIGSGGTVGGVTGGYTSSKKGNINGIVGEGTISGGITGGITGSTGGGAWGIIGSKGVSGSTFGGGIGGLSGGAVKSNEGNSGWSVAGKTDSNGAGGGGAFGGISGGFTSVIGGKNGGSLGGITGSKGDVSGDAAGSSFGEIKGMTTGSKQGGMGYEIKNGVDQGTEGSLNAAVRKGVEGGQVGYTSGGLEGEFDEEYEIITYTYTWEEVETDSETEVTTEYTIME